MYFGNFESLATLSCALAFLQRETSDEPREMEVAAAFKGTLFGRAVRIRVIQPPRRVN